MSVKNSVVLMDQYADTAALTGLAHVGLPESINASGSVVLTMHSVTGLLMLRAAESAPALSDALKRRCGVSLSVRLQCETHEMYCIRWMSPDCWLLSCPLDEAYAIEQALRADIDGHIAIVNVSGGYSIVELSGSDAHKVLMKSTGYDVHPDNFGVGKVVNTTFAKAQVMMRVLELNENDGRYELIVRRSFSDYLWLWLQRAGSEYGMAAMFAGVES